MLKPKDFTSLAEVENREVGLPSILLKPKDFITLAKVGNREVGVSSVQRMCYLY